MNDKKKLFMIISICVLIVTVIASSITYAWYTWSTSESEETRIVTSMGTARVFYNGGADITNAVLKPTADREEDGIVKSITVKTDKDTTYKISFNLYLDVTSIDEGLKDVSFRYALYKEGQTEAVKEGNFSQSHLDSNLAACTTNSTNHIVLVTDETVTTTTQKYKLYIWIDGENYANSNAMQGKTFSFKLHADGENAVLGGEEKFTLVEHINNLYNTAEKSVVTNGDIDYDNAVDYNYAQSVNLMNDRLGTMDVGADAGNIRYYGENPNNYIDLGDTYKETTVINNMEKNLHLMDIARVDSEEACHEFFDCNVNHYGLQDIFTSSEITDVNSCKMVFDYENTEEVCSSETKLSGDKVLYRIIGLFKDVELADGTKKDLVKVIREESIGKFAWDEPNEYGAGVSNNWHEATLNNILNNKYLTSSSSFTHYYSNYLTFARETAVIDFTNIGINSIQNKIEKVVWNLGGFDQLVWLNEIYNYERGEAKCSDCTYETTWEGKIALAYPSDYGYSADLSLCSSLLDSYYECNSVNWISSISNGNEWFLTPESFQDVYAWYSSNGELKTFDRGVDSGFEVRPTFYLDASLVLLSGDGSEGNPYIVG